MSPVPPDYLYVDYEDAIALVDGILTRPSPRLVRFLSIGGPPEAVRAVLAGATEGKHLMLVRKKERTSLQESGREYVDTVQMDRRPCHRIFRRLPCGQAHGVLYLDHEDPKEGFTFLLPKAEEAQAADRLLQKIDAQTTLPLHRSWAPWVWEQLEEMGCLTPLVGMGPWVGWDFFVPEAGLTEAVMRAVKHGHLHVA